MSRLLDFLASLRLTVALLVASIVVVFLATLEQVAWGVWHVQDAYFESWGVLYPLAEPAPAKVPLPGGFLLGALLCANLVVAHFRHHKPGLARSGISLIHGGLLLLLVGGFAIARYQKEAALAFAEGETKAYVEAFRDHEVAITEVGASDDHVTVIPEALLRGGDTETKVGRAGEVTATVRGYRPNAILRPLSQAPQLTPLALRDAAGLAAGQPMGIAELPESFDDNRPDNPCAVVRLALGDQAAEVATSLLLHENFPPQQVTLGGRTYEVALRRERTYLPFALELRKFTHERHPGTEIPRRFSSDVVLHEGGLSRGHLISMNEPLRHGGLTFYQSSYGQSDGKPMSVLQVVRNPAAWIPYAAVLIMSAGLVLHFGISLVRFLRARGAAAAKVGALLLAAALPSGASAAEAPRADLAREFGDLPVQFNGRIIPVERLATNTLVQLRGRRTVSLDETDRVIFGKPRSQWTAADKALVAARVPAVPEAALASLERRPFHLTGGSLGASEWLAEVAFRPWVARHLRVFRVDHADLHGLLGRAQGENKFYSWEELVVAIEPIGKAAEAARAHPQADRDAGERALLNLETSARAYAAISLAFAPPDLPAEVEPLREYLAWHAYLRQAAEELAKSRAAGSAKLPDELQSTLQSLLKRYQDMAREGTVGLFSRGGAERWTNLGEALLEVAEGKPLDTPDVVPGYARLAQAWRQGEDAAAAREIRLLAAQLGGAHDDKVAGEAAFIRAEPFYKALIAYFLLLLAVLAHWLTGKEGLRVWATRLAWAAFALHTGAILFRMWLHGYAPVTNLYGSTLFVAWGGVLIGLLLERAWRNGLGTASACAAGFGSLILAHNMALAGEDALEAMRAVLDSNFWLSTHVTIVTLGYSAMFVAGLLATFHLIGRLASARYDERTAAALARAAYGVLAFATVASFVGTMLGGVWADQSWGRFWGWDPKENGALLIVLWCAVALHSRWGGLVDREGLMQMLVFGNIVTAWSWFGTNLLGVGLHSYGFTESGFFWLMAFVVSQLAIIALGWLPARGAASQA